LYSLSLMISILSRDRLAEVIALYQAHNIAVNLITLGYGTATNDVLDLLGLDSSEKAVCFSMVTEESWKAVKKALQQKIRIDVPGTGIAFTVPVSSIGGRRELMFFTDQQNFTKGEESTLQNTTHELLIVVSNQRYGDLVMDAARAAGAPGGTVIHAKGTGMERAEQFLGISLAAEKELTFIVVKTEQKNAIMQSIMENAGIQTKAKSIVFSLPVTNTAGLRLLEDET